MPSDFITTEPIGCAGKSGEQTVWDAVRRAFAGRTCLAYWRYPIFSRTGGTRKEPDILIADRQLGLVVIEVKSVRIEQISSIAHQIAAPNSCQMPPCAKSWKPNQSAGGNQGTRPLA